MSEEKSGILLRGEKFTGSKPPHGGSWLYDPETDTLTLLEPPTAEAPSRARGTAKHLPTKLHPDRECYNALVRKPFLSKAEYGNVLSLSIKFGCLMPGPQAGIERFVARLGEERGKWKEIIRQGAGRLGELERENFICLLQDAEGDPLRFLNLAGIALGNIFAEIEYLKIQKAAQDALGEMRRSKVKRKKVAAAISEAAQYVDQARPFVDSYLRWADHLTIVPKRLVPRPSWEVPNRDQYPRGDWLKAIAWIIKNADNLRLIPPGTDRKGGPRKDLLGYAAYKVRSICESAIEESLKQERDEKRRSNILIGKTVLWGPLTALLMASFPEWFKRDTDSVRNVRNALRAFRTGKYTAI